MRTDSSAAAVAGAETIACLDVVATADVVEKPAFEDPLVTLVYVQSACTAGSPGGCHPDFVVALPFVQELAAYSQADPNFSMMEVAIECPLAELVGAEDLHEDLLYPQCRISNGVTIELDWVSSLVAVAAAVVVVVVEASPVT